ncbi:MAG: tRNA pseudouridine(13) synthase TruD [Candidatus Hydrothermarchaeales archaeon]
MKSNYGIDKIIGLDYFITDTKGIGGRLRQRIEDFSVEELFDPAEEDPKGEYTHFILEKRDWETLKAIKVIAKALRVSRKRFGFAGTKDKRAVTRQRVAVWKVEPEELAKVKIKDLSLSGFRKSDKRVNLGDAEGNIFRVIVRALEDGEDLKDTVLETETQLHERGIPNYFGYQRFGVVRPNTHIVGEELIKGDIKGAVMAYLCNPFENEKEDAYNARRLLEETGDIKVALKTFPTRLNYERAMLEHLSHHPNDYVGALRRLPKKLRWMLVHAYQSYLFNKILSKMIGEGVTIRHRKVPLFGFDSEFSEGEQGDMERSILEEESVSLGDFKIPSMPELSLKGRLREACIETDIDTKIGEDELNENRLKCVVEFSLPTGSYATTLLREFMKTDPLNY